MIRETLCNGRLKTTGAGIILSNARNEIAIIEEKGSSRITQKRAGDLSIPLETAKRQQGEQELFRDTLLGAMAEVIDDKILQRESGHFRLITRKPYIAQMIPHLTIGLVFVRFAGDPDCQLTPTAIEETANPEWMDPEKVLFSSRSLRPFAKQLLEHVVQEGLLEAVKHA